MLYPATKWHPAPAAPLRREVLPPFARGWWYFHIFACLTGAGSLAAAVLA